MSTCILYERVFCVFFLNVKPQVREKKKKRSDLACEYGLIRGLCIFHVLLICFDSVTQCIHSTEKPSRACPFCLQPGFMASNELCVEGSEGES